MKKYRCPVCENAPKVTVSEGITTIDCCGICVHEGFFFVAVRRWKRLYKLFAYENANKENDE